jgi:ATP-binding cassette subfamily B protein
MIGLIRKFLRGPALVCALFAPLSMMREVFMDLQQPILMSRIIDVGVAAGDAAYVLNTGAWMIVFAVLGFVGGVGCGTLSTYAATQMGAGMRREPSGTHAAK